MAVNATLMDDLLPMKPLFQSNIPSIDLVSNQIYHRIDGILLASSKACYAPVGYEELAWEMEPVRNGEIFSVNNR